MVFGLTARLVAACVLAVVCGVTPAFAASNIYLEIEGIKGESRVVPGAVDVMAYSYDVKSPRDAASGLATGKRSAAAGEISGDGSVRDVNISDVSIVCPSGQSSPQLMLACATGKHIPQAILSCRKAGSDQTYLKITMKDLLVSSFASSGGSADDLPTESISLNFSEITFEYFLSGGDTPISIKFVVKK